MPPDLDYPSGVELWRLTTSVPTSGPFGDAARREVNLVGRLRPGVTVEQAASEIASLNERLGSEAAVMRGLVPVVRPFADVIVGDVRIAMLALFGAVGLLLLIASANVANLLLLRGEARRGELALRLALGAGRSRIVRQVLAESAVLAVLAGAAGLAIATAIVPVLITIIPEGLPRIESIRVDESVVLFAMAVAFVAALLAGLTRDCCRSVPTWCRRFGLAAASPPPRRARGAAVRSSSARWPWRSPCWLPRACWSAAF